jgi:glycosyltransferase involved in cell wall biosynthesis
LNIAGFLDAESGVGEVARRIAAALVPDRVPTALVAHRTTDRRQRHPHDLPLSTEATFDTNLVCLNPGHLEQFVADVGAKFFAGRYSIGLWFWETDVMPAREARAARLFDELWVASNYVRAAVEPVVDIPVELVPVPLGTWNQAGDAEPHDPSAFTFLFVFDFWSEPRKNAPAVVDAFKKAFAPDEGPTLVLKSVHGSSKPHELRRLMDAGAGRADVVVRDGYLTSAELASEFAACDCYVSLHRSEGLGLTLADAMALGKPVIATAYSGNLEFMNEANSYLVPYRLVDVPDGWPGFSPGARWAEPEIDTAAQLMRRVWEHPEEARRVGQIARDDLRSRFGPRRTMDFVRARLDEIHDEGAVAARLSHHDARPSIVEASLEVERGRTMTLEGQPSRRVASVVRRLLERALWTRLEHEHRLGEAVVESLTSLQRSVDALERRVRELEDARSREAGSAPGEPPTAARDSLP